jgi:hypothetical protein
MLDAIGKALVALEFEYLEQFVVALLPMSLTVVIHGYGMKIVGGYFRRYGASAHATRRRHPGVVVAITVSGILLATHFAEVSLWAAFYFMTGMLASLQSAMNFSVNSYTTLGASNIQLTGRWIGFDGFEAMTAMLMFGWSTAVLAVVVQKTHSIEG